jgi:hypothetical protein
MKLETGNFTLSTGELAYFEYEPESDFLEIFFRQGEATYAVALTDSIILRFDWETAAPLSLSLVSASKLMQPAEYGQMYFEVSVDEWPEEALEKIWSMLREPPLTDFLRLGSYAPAYAYQVIPLATLKQSPLIAHAA